jgi:hypothetical protein
MLFLVFWLDNKILMQEHVSMVEVNQHTPTFSKDVGVDAFSCL